MFSVYKDALISLCCNFNPKRVWKSVKFPAQTYLESTCRNLFILLLCFNFCNFCPSLIFPCEVIFLNLPCPLQCSARINVPKTFPITWKTRSLLPSPTHSLSFALLLVSFHYMNTGDHMLKMRS